MSKHTPGPWKWMEDELNGRLCKRLGKGRSKINKQDGALVYALVGPLKGPTTMDENLCDVFDYREVMVLHWSKVRGDGIYEGFPCKEDAALIAAAPDLLAALHRIAKGQFDSSISSAEQVACIREVARAAIAKAGGAS